MHTDTSNEIAQASADFEHEKSASLPELLDNLNKIAPPHKAVPQIVSVPGAWVREIQAAIQAVLAIQDVKLRALNIEPGGAVIFRTEYPEEINEGAIQLVVEEAQRVADALDSGEPTPPVRLLILGPDLDIESLSMAQLAEVGLTTIGDNE